MPIVFGCVAPHGFTLIPDVSEDAEGGLDLREAMFELARRCRATNPEVLVVATPHGFRVDGALCLANVGRAAGTLGRPPKTLEMNIPVDLPLTDAITAAARARDIPIALGGFGGTRREGSVIPLDWGVVTPVWFLGHPYNATGHGSVLAAAPDTQGPAVVIVTPSRAVPRTKLVEFGKAVAEAAARDGRRVAFVASCDWGHRHSEHGPYGYDPAAKEVDLQVVELLKQNDPMGVMAISDERAQQAAIDGLWQTLMLAGVKEVVPLRGEVLAYGAPTYYGMIVAAFEPATA